MAKSRPLRCIAGVYVWIFRGTPLLVQIALIYFGLGVTRIYSWPDHQLFGDFGKGAVQAGIVALGVNEGAYMAEIVRAGILSIDPGQMEAAKSLGMTFGQSMRRIVLPQAARVIVPPLGNEFNNMLKTTSLLVVDRRSRAVRDRSRSRTRGTASPRSSCSSLRRSGTCS